MDSRIHSSQARGVTEDRRCDVTGHISTAVGCVHHSGSSAIQYCNSSCPACSLSIDGCEVCCIRDCMAGPRTGHNRIIYNQYTVQLQTTKSSITHLRRHEVHDVYTLVVEVSITI